MTVDLSHLDNYVAQAQAGELNTDSNEVWPDTGVCFVTSAEFKNSQNGSSLLLSFNLKHADTGREKETSLVMPGVNDKYAGMKIGNVGATLYAMMGAGVKEAHNGQMSAFYSRVRQHLTTHFVKVNYTMETESKFSEKHGKELVTQYLRSFTRIDSVPRTTPVVTTVPQSAPQPVAAPAQAAPTTPPTGAFF